MTTSGEDSGDDQNGLSSRLRLDDFADQCLVVSVWVHRSKIFWTQRGVGLELAAVKCFRREENRGSVFTSCSRRGWRRAATMFRLGLLKLWRFGPRSITCAGEDHQYHLFVPIAFRHSPHPNDGLPPPGAMLGIKVATIGQ